MSALVIDVKPLTSRKRVRYDGPMEPIESLQSTRDALAGGPDAAFAAFCPRFHHAVEVLGRRWTGAILRAMLVGRLRYSEIAATVPGLSDRLLSERLRELEAEGIVMREVFPETPVRIEYHLTEKGRALAPAIEALAEWAETWLPLPEPEPAT
jgi:DNA-binding HxlR family transcriptional regulator